MKLECEGFNVTIAASHPPRTAGFSVRIATGRPPPPRLEVPTGESTPPLWFHALSLIPEPGPLLTGRGWEGGEARAECVPAAPREQDACEARQVEETKAVRQAPPEAWRAFLTDLRANAPSAPRHTARLYFCLLLCSGDRHANVEPNLVWARGSLHVVLFATERWPFKAPCELLMEYQDHGVLEVFREVLWQRAKHSHLLHAWHGRLMQSCRHYGISVPDNAGSPDCAARAAGDRTAPRLVPEAECFAEARRITAYEVDLTPATLQKLDSYTPDRSAPLMQWKGGAWRQRIVDGLAPLVAVVEITGLDHPVRQLVVPRPVDDAQRQWPKTPQVCRDPLDTY